MGNSRAKENTFEANFPTHLISPPTLTLYLDVEKRRKEAIFSNRKNRMNTKKCTKFSYEYISRRERHIWKVLNEQSIRGSTLFIASCDFHYFICGKTVLA